MKFIMKIHQDLLNHLNCILLDQGYTNLFWWNLLDNLNLLACKFYYVVQIRHIFIVELHIFHQFKSYLKNWNLIIFSHKTITLLFQSPNIRCFFLKWDLRYSIRNLIIYHRIDLDNFFSLMIIIIEQNLLYSSNNNHY